MVEDMPKDWAIEKALSLGFTGTTLADVKRHWPGHAMTLAFARYIAEHEQEPIDPLLIEARKIAKEARLTALGTAKYGYAHDSVANKIGAGQWDDHNLVVASLAALRRGIEISEGGKLAIGEEG